MHHANTETLWLVLTNPIPLSILTFEENHHQEFMELCMCTWTIHCLVLLFGGYVLLQLAFPLNITFLWFFHFDVCGCSSVTSIAGWYTTVWPCCNSPSIFMVNGLFSCFVIAFGAARSDCMQDCQGAEDFTLMSQWI